MKGDRVAPVPFVVPTPGRYQPPDTVVPLGAAQVVFLPKVVPDPATSLM